MNTIDIDRDELLLYLSRDVCGFSQIPVNWNPLDNDSDVRDLLDEMADVKKWAWSVTREPSGADYRVELRHQLYGRVEHSSDEFRTAICLAVHDAQEKSKNHVD